MSRSHPQQGAIRDQVERPDPAVVAALSSLASTLVADCGAPIGVVGPGIGPVAGGREVCGPAVTVWTKPGDILYVLRAPDVVQPGDVLVIDGGGRLDAAVIGEIIGQAIQRNGAVGLVVDGVVRDIDGLNEIGLPTFARGVHPATASNDGPGAINVTVQCGGVRVEPGDVVRADSSGIVVIPRRRAAEVLALAREVAAKEERWLAAIASGQTVAQATGVEQRIAERGRPD